MPVLTCITPWLLALPLYTAWYCLRRLCGPVLLSARGLQLAYAGLVMSVTGLLLVGLGMALPFLRPPLRTGSGGFLLWAGLLLGCALYPSLRYMVQAYSWSRLQRWLFWLADALALLWVALHWF